MPVISTAWDSVTAAECAAASEAAVGRHAAFLGAALEPLPKKETAAQVGPGIYSHGLQNKFVYVVFLFSSSSSSCFFFFFFFFF